MLANTTGKGKYPTLKTSIDPTIYPFLKTSIDPTISAESAPAGAQGESSPEPETSGMGLNTSKRISGFLSFLNISFENHVLAQARLAGQKIGVKH